MPASTAPAPAQHRPLRAQNARPASPASGRTEGPRPEPKTLFQKYFKSVGTRTYAAQVKEAANGNHFIVLTEGRRDEKTDEVKKHSVYVFSEDFDAFRDLLRDTFTFVRDHPVPPDVKAKRDAFWKKQAGGAQRQGDKARGRQGD